MDDLRSLLELMQTRVLEALGEIPDDRLHWRPTRASTSPAEIVWHMVCVERARAAVMAGEEPAPRSGDAGTRGWIETAAAGQADITAVPRDRAGLVAALVDVRRETLARPVESAGAGGQPIGVNFGGEPPPP
jgi:hypothetical protein